MGAAPINDKSSSEEDEYKSQESDYSEEDYADEDSANENEPFEIVTDLFLDKMNLYGERILSEIDKGHFDITFYE